MATTIVAWLFTNGRLEQDIPVLRDGDAWVILVMILSSRLQCFHLSFRQLSSAWHLTEVILKRTRYQVPYTFSRWKTKVQLSVMSTIIYTFAFSQTHSSLPPLYPLSPVSLPSFSLSLSVSHSVSPYSVSLALTLSPSQLKFRFMFHTHNMRNMKTVGNNMNIF